MTERRWKANPGKREKAKDENKMVWLRFRGGHENTSKVRAGGYKWNHRGWDFDIMEASDDD